MKKERIPIEGERYLIYYTFDDETRAAADAEEPAKRPEMPEPPKACE